MARWRKPVEDKHPEKFLRFDPEEWPGTPVEAFDAWNEAEKQYWQRRFFPGGVKARFQVWRAGKLRAQQQ